MANHSRHSSLAIALFDKAVPPGDATNTPTDVQLRRNPYLTGAEGGLSVYDVYYGGIGTMMPWLGHGPR